VSETTAERGNGVAGRAGEWLPLREAAERLGVSLDSVRRRLRANTLRARQEPILGGHRWLVWVDGDGRAGDATGVAPPTPRGSARGMAQAATPWAEGATPPEDGAGGEPTPSAPPPGPPGDQAGATHATQQAPAGALVAAQRAEEMARYTAALLEPWRQRVEELSRENGRLEDRAEHLEAERDAARADLEHARAELERARTEAEAARRETEETVRLAEEAAGLRAAAEAGARRPWWRFW
jgi:hypothetical protein